MGGRSQWHANAREKREISGHRGGNAWTSCNRICDFGSARGAVTAATRLGWVLTFLYVHKAITQFVQLLLHFLRYRA